MKQILLFISFLFLNNLASQNYNISTIPVNNNNQSSTSTKKLYIDNQRFLWYSTHHGIVKEMGNKNSHFYEYATSKNKDIYTFDLLKSSKNKLWSVTGEGLNIIDLETGKSEWKTVKYPETNTIVTFTSIKEDKQGNMWLATDKNYLYCYTNKNELISSKILKSDYNSTTNSYYGAASKIITILDDGSLILHQDKKWFRVKDGISYLIFNDSSFFTPTKTASTILIDNNSLFPSKTSGTYTYNNILYSYKYIKDINKQIVQVPYKDVTFISNLDNQNFYKKINFIAIDKTKLIALTFNKNEDNSFTLNDEEVFTLKNNITNAIYDKAGYFLLHTESGISKIRYNSIGFKKHLNGKNISCRGFSEDAQGNIYVLTYKGIFKLDKGNDTFKELDSIKDTKTYKKVITVSYNFIKENDDTFWFYGFHESLIKFNVNEGTFETYKFPAERVLITDAERIKGSKLMLATSIGLYSFDLKTKTFKNESKLNEKINLENISVVELMLNKRKTALWIATKNKDHALVKIDYSTNIISSFGPEKKGMPLINHEITNIFEDEKSNLWLGTLNGLEKINPVNYLAAKFTLTEGLSNDNISGILEDKNYLWISTFNGLIKLNKKTQTIRTFYEEDGIPNNEFNRKSFIKASNGNLFFGGLNGIVSFDPKVISKNDHNYRIFLTEYEKYDEDNKGAQSFYNSNESISKFNIPYNQNYLTLKFAINDILDPNKNIYQYRITELSTNWTNLGNHNTLQLQGLNPGNYNLEIRGFSSNGNRTNLLKYDINVTQVFYKKTWFIALIILALLSFLTVKNIIKEARIIKIYKRKIKIQKLRYNAMNAQKDPRFLFDTLANLKEVMLKNGKCEATEYFNVFSNFIDTKVSMNDSINILIKDEIEYLKSYLKLENLRLGNRIDIRFEIDKAIETNKEKIPCMLFKPIIEDALINGIIPKKYDLKLSLSFKLKNGNLIGEVADNGIPRVIEKKRKRKKKPQSEVTSIMEHRIKLANSLLTEKIKYTIVDIKSEGDHLGTKSTLIIPLNNFINPKRNEDPNEDDLNYET